MHKTEYTRFNAVKQLCVNYDSEMAYESELKMHTSIATSNLFKHNKRKNFHNKMIREYLKCCSQTTNLNLLVKIKFEGGYFPLCIDI